MRAFTVPAALAVALLLLVSGAPASADSFSGNSCSPDRDPGISDGAVVVELPRRCDVTGSNGSDGYRFYLESGQRVWARAVFPDDAFDGRLCIVRPSEPDFRYGRCEDFGTTLVWDVVADETGYWEVDVQGSSTYQLALSRNHTVFTGTILVGATDGRLSEPEGPTGNSFDGAWVSLPRVGTGDETVILRTSTMGAVEAHFYDADLARIPYEACAQFPRAVEDCAAPGGAAWAFVHGGLALEAYVLEYRH